MLKINKLVLILIALTMISSILYSEFNSASPDEILYNVSLSGAVKNPGVFAVPPSARVSSVLKLSETEYLDALKYKKETLDNDEELKLLVKKYEQYYPEDTDEEDQSLNASLRNIILKRGDKEIVVDLFATPGGATRTM